MVPAAAQRADRISTDAPVSAQQLVMLLVVGAGVVLLNDRAPDFVRYTLLLVLAYLLITNAAGVARLGESMVGALNAATRGG